MERVWYTARLHAVLAALAVACARAPAAAPTTTTQPIEVMSWWRWGAEQTALARLFEEHKKLYPSEDVVLGRLFVTAYRKQMSSRLRQGDPPDINQAIAGQDLRQW